jgi:hypothetical protein
MKFSEAKETGKKRKPRLLSMKLSETEGEEEKKKRKKKKKTRQPPPRKILAVD